MREGFAQGGLGHERVSSGEALQAGLIGEDFIGTISQIL